MSSEAAIRVSHLGKCYQVYEKPHDRLKQFLIPRLWRLLPPLRRFFSEGNAAPPRFYKEFKALDDVSFELGRGETVGIIGRNGSGKSTLLQLICGTLNPTSGSIETRGRTAALLELGSGFNPEFTGRENVYLNAAVLGLDRDEIDRRFESMAAFADIGEFIDQPVKNYSSGMYVRLAFAVIAHVDADILIIDEALSVGDAVFTQKCMRFIRQFRKRGTLLFVSHDMNSVLNLCERVVWLHQGQVREIGEAKETAENYLHYTHQEISGKDLRLQSVGTSTRADSRDWVPAPAAEPAPVIDYASELQVSGNLSEANGWKTGAGEILSVQLESLDDGERDILKGGERVRMTIRALAHEAMDRPILGFLLRDRLGQDLLGENTLPFTALNPRPISAGTTVEGEFVFRLPMLPNGQYTVMASLADGDLHHHVQHHWLHDALVLNVSSSKIRWGLVGVPFEKIDLREVA
jgi:lipopolysaccharide transport system ATP-binding protein